MSAASRTQRAMGPTTSRVLPASGITPALGTRAKVGLMPTRPWAEAGFWIDPPVSSALTLITTVIPSGAKAAS